MKTPWVLLWNRLWSRLGSGNWARFAARVRAGWKGRWGRRRTGRLRLVESISLGDRRSAGILEIEGRRFLIGATPQAVTLLGELGERLPLPGAVPSAQALLDTEGTAKGRGAGEFSGNSVGEFRRNIDGDSESVA